MIKVGTLVQHVLDLATVGIVTGMETVYARIRWPDGSVSMEHYEHLEILWGN